jgi:hypothetical protein
MTLTDKDVRVANTDEELLIFDVSDDALERAAGIPRDPGDNVDVSLSTAAVPSSNAKLISLRSHSVFAMRRWVAGDGCGCLVLKWIARTPSGSWKP